MLSVIIASSVENIFQLKPGEACDWRAIRSCKKIDGNPEEPCNAPFVLDRFPTSFISRRIERKEKDIKENADIHRKVDIETHH